MIEETKSDSTPPTDPAKDLPGVLRAEVDPVDQSVVIDFDPNVISDEGVGKVAEGLAPVESQPFRRCLRKSSA